MATPYITSVNDPIVKMVQDYSVIVKGATGSIPPQKILDYLNNHAFPRIRGRLLGATDGSGAHIFYTNLGDLGDSSAQQRASELVLAVMTDSIVKDYVFRVAAALAGAWAIRFLVGQIKEQADIGKDLEKEAMDDLKALCTSPELKSAIAEAQAKESNADLPRFYLALDLDPATYNATTNTAETYAGALERGSARLWVGPHTINVPVEVGDTPSIIMNNLATALRAYMIANPPPNARFNLVLGPNEGSVSSTARSIQVTNGFGQTVTATPSLSLRLGYMAMHAYQYDTEVDALFVTLELTRENGTLGINGLLYGVNPQGYGNFSKNGPVSAFIDVSSGKLTRSTSPAVTENPLSMSNSFYFTVPGVGGVTTKEGVVRYQSANLVSVPGTAPNAKQPRVVSIPAGSTAMDVVQAIARDMDQIGYQQKFLPALRSPTSISVQGSTVTAPGLQLVPYRVSSHETRLIVDILEVPSEVEFGVVPPSLATTGVFDNQPKSLVLDILYAKEAITAGGGVSPLAELTGSARIVEAQISSRMQSALNDIGFFNRGYF